MGRFIDLPGVEGGVIEGDQAKFITSVSSALRATRAVPPLHGRRRPRSGHSVA